MKGILITTKRELKEILNDIEKFITDDAQLTMIIERKRNEIYFRIIEDHGSAC